MWNVRLTPGSDDAGTVKNEWGALLTEGGASNESPGMFPHTATKRILEELRSISSGSAVSAIIAGVFYRDLNDDGRINAGEEFPATLLGTPELVDSRGLSPCQPELFYTCYWFGPVEAKDWELRFSADGVAPVAIACAAQPGLNIVHIPIIPIKPLVYVVPHSHFDTEWYLTYEECLRNEEIPNLKSRLDLLQEEPAHCFCMDEECVTQPFWQRVGNDYRRMLRAGFADGTIEPKGIVTQQELTMPYGEALIRGITMGEIML